jgi:hypothetical protein
VRTKTELVAELAAELCGRHPLACGATHRATPQSRRSFRRMIDETMAGCHTTTAATAVTQDQPSAQHLAGSTASSLSSVACRVLI